MDQLNDPNRAHPQDGDKDSSGVCGPRNVMWLGHMTRSITFIWPYFAVLYRWLQVKYSWMVTLAGERVGKCNMRAWMLHTGHKNPPNMRRSSYWCS
jgi:hypothetical protein